MTREEAINILAGLYVVNISGNEHFAEQRNEAIDMAIEALDYTEWLEKIIVEAETFEWLCEDATDKEWCEKNCKYESIQAECLRHLYEIGKGGGDE